MALPLTEQLNERIRSSRQHLVVFPRMPRSSPSHANKDAIASALALAAFLKAKGATQVDIVSDEFTAPRALSFLSDVALIQSSLPPVQKCLIDVPLSDAGIASLTYDVRGSMLTIAITPSRGSIEPSAIQARTSAFLYDCIWILDAQDWSSLGTVYSQHTDVFHHVPTVVLDHHTSNEHFGTINIIDITATSTAEVVYTLLESLDPHHITPEIATMLLTGIIGKTRGFRNKKVGPRTLALASTLMGLGAKRDLIVDYLFRQRSISTLKLWGEALSNLTQDTQYHVVLSRITRDAFVRAGATEDELPEIIDELIVNAPEAAYAILLYESPSADHIIHGFAYTEQPLDIRELTAPFSPRGDERFATLMIAAPNLVEASRHVLEHLRAILSAKNQ